MSASTPPGSSSIDHVLGSGGVRSEAIVERKLIREKSSLSPVSIGSWR